MPSKKKKLVKKAVLGIGATKPQNTLLDELLPEIKQTSYHPQQKNDDNRVVLPIPVMQSPPISHPDKPPLAGEKKAPPTIKDREIALKELELDFMRTFAGDKYQNTHITADQRQLIAIIYDNIVSNPYPESKKHAIENGIPWNDSEFHNQPVADYLMRFLGLGLPVDRQGRDEIVKMYQAYKQNEMREEKKEDSQMIK